MNTGMVRYRKQKQRSGHLLDYNSLFFLGKFLSWNIQNVLAFSISNVQFYCFIFLFSFQISDYSSFELTLDVPALNFFLSLHEITSPFISRWAFHYHATGREKETLCFGGFTVFICSLFIYALFIFQSHKLQLQGETEIIYRLLNASIPKCFSFRVRIKNYMQIVK